MNKKIKINLTEHDVSFFSLWAEAVDMPIEKLIERIVRDTLKKGAERMLAVPLGIMLGLAYLGRIVIRLLETLK